MFGPKNTIVKANSTIYIRKLRIEKHLGDHTQLLTAHATASLLRCTANYISRDFGSIWSFCHVRQHVLFPSPMIESNTNGL